MAKSRNRSRDAKKRTKKKRLGRMRLQRLRDQENALTRMQEIATLSNPKFASTHCSQCGKGFGPGNSGYSHCEDHFGIAGIED